MAQPRLNLSDEYAVIELANPIAPTITKVLEYAPRTPDEDQTWTPPDSWNGERLLDRKYRNVTESARVLITSTSVAAIRTFIQSIESLFTRAKMVQKRGLGNPPNVVLQAEGLSDTAYTSPILSGRVDVPASALNLGWRNLAVEVLITWTRAPYWEGGIEIASLRSPQGTVTAGAKTFYNTTDADNWNSSDILAPDGVSAVSGTLPTPLTVEVTNTTGTALGAFWVGVWSGDGNPASFSNIREAEGTPNMAQTPGSANTTYSGNFYGASASLPANAESVLMEVDFDHYAQESAQGRYFRVLMNVLNGSQFPAGTRYRLALEWAGELVWFGPYMRTPDTLNPGGPGDALIDWGVVQVPPAFVAKWLGTGLPTFATLSLQFRMIPTTTRTWNVDYVSLVATDSIRQYIPTNVTGFANNDKVTDEGTTGSVFLTRPVTGSMKPIRIVGEAPLMAIPGVPNRIYWNGMGVDRSAAATRTVSIRVTYRPRRLTV